MTKKEFEKLIDQYCEAVLGCSFRDLPDVAWMDYYYDDMTEKSAHSAAHDIVSDLIYDNIGPVTGQAMQDRLHEYHDSQMGIDSPASDGSKGANLVDWDVSYSIRQWVASFHVSEEFNTLFRYAKPYMKTRTQWRKVIFTITKNHWDNRLLYWQVESGNFQLTLEKLQSFYAKAERYL